MIERSSLEGCQQRSGRLHHSCGEIDLERVAPTLPEPKWVEDMDSAPVDKPPELVEGILHQGCKMILSGKSKTNKSWCLLDLALSVASGQPWWGRKCKQVPVIYINFELHEWEMQDRRNKIRKARPECEVDRRQLALWNLRGHSADLTTLRPKLEKTLRQNKYGLVILDPVYKLLGDRNENSNGEIAEMMNQLELLAQASGAAMVLAHHFAKGNARAKEAVDRMSGAGTWARDADALLVLTPYKDGNHYTVSAILRHFEPIPDWVVKWDCPLMWQVPDLNPEALRRKAGRKRCFSNEKFLKRFFPTAQPRLCRDIIADGLAMRISEATMHRYLAMLVKAGLLMKGNGLYWKKEETR